MFELFLVTSDDATQRTIAQILERESPGGTRLLRLQDWSELEGSISRRPASLVLVDLNRGSESLERFEPLIRRSRRTSFVFVCDELHVDLVLKAMQIGARHCLMRKKLSAELPPLLARLREDGNSATSAAEGQVVTVLSAGGGCGATTVAINLAEELRLLSDGEALLVDLDRFTGAMATYLGTQCEYGIADVLGCRRTIDAHFVRSSATPCGQGLHLLGSPASVDFAGRAELALENLGRVLPACGAAFRWTVIDAPRCGIDATVQLAQSSVLTIVLFQLSVVDVRITRSLVTALIDRGIARECIRPVANRYHKGRALVTLDDADAALEGVELARLPNDYDSAIRALDLGQPLASVAPRSPLRKGIRDLAVQITSRESATAPGNG